MFVSSTHLHHKTKESNNSPSKKTVFFFGFAKEQKGRKGSKKKSEFIKAMMERDKTDKTPKYCSTFQNLKLFFMTANAHFSF